MNKRILTIIVIVVAALSVSATDYTCSITSDYYSAANGKKGDAIRVALSSVVASHTNVGYDGLYTLYQTSDVRDDGTIWDMYSDCDFSPTGDKCGSYKNVCDCFNREHSLPKSWWGGGSAAQYSDAFHLVPTDGYVNNQRSNYPFGECEEGIRLSPKARGRLGSSTFSGYSGTVFEPDDEYKGDFARGYMYMLCAYKSVNFTSGNGSNMFTYSNGMSYFNSYAISLLMKWHREDPVSRKELNRNEAIYAKQHNRNPFIDYPCLAEYIWGDMQEESVDFSQLMSAYDASFPSTDQSGCSCTINEPTITAPKNASTFNVGAANIGTAVVKDLTIKGVLLTKNVTLTISGTNAAYFSVSASSVLPTETGVVVVVSYNPAVAGNHTATLTIASTEAESVTVTLTGSCVTELVSPTSSPLVLTAENVGEVISQTILVKGTNLSNPITLSLSGTDAAFYTISETTISATDAMAGKNITLTYTPTMIGKHSVTLVVSSDDFSAVNVPINGSCTFEALPATNLTANSFIANWTNAGVSNYTLDVYTKVSNDTEEKLLFEEYFDDKELTCSNAKTSGNVYWDNDTSIRLGTGSTAGTVAFSGVDLSKGGRIVVRACYYNTDASATLKVVAGSVSKTLSLTKTYTDYEVEIPANAANTSISVTLSSAGGSNMRVWVADLRVYVGSTVITNESVVGYPRSVGNVVAYLVEGVDLENNKYYYTVTPDGYDISEEIEVSEEYVPSAIDEVSLTSLSFRVGNVWHISGIPQGSVLRLVTASGIILENTVATDSEVRFDLPLHGVYILQIENKGSRQTLKMSY